LPIRRKQPKCVGQVVFALGVFVGQPGRNISQRGCVKTVKRYVYFFYGFLLVGGIQLDPELSDSRRMFDIIFRMLADGKTSKEIALITETSVKTVDACRRRIMQKLTINSVAELVKYAIREGLTTVDQ